MRVLVTRPQPEAERTAAALRECGHIAVVAPVLHIEAIADAKIGAGPYAAILITSVNAARALAAHRELRRFIGTPAFAVGTRSAQTMRAAGFADVIAADGDAAELARLIAARLSPGASLLYLAGEDRSGDLAGELSGRGYSVQTTVLYRAIAASQMPQAAADALASGVDVVLHYSRRSAEAYLNAARASGALAAALEPGQFCLSEQIAEPLRRAGAAIVHVAPRPAESALLDLIRSNSV